MSLQQTKQLSPSTTIVASLLLLLLMYIRGGGVLILLEIEIPLHFQMTLQQTLHGPVILVNGMLVLQQVSHG